MSKIRFTKMHGAGNDYIYVYTPDNPLDNPSEMAAQWSKYHTGIGSDGLILIGKSDKADFSMRMFNNDGSEGIMCGNGVRCVGKFVYDHRLTSKKTVTVETLGGVKILQLFTADKDLVASVTVDMDEPILADTKLLSTSTGSMQKGIVEACGKKYEGTFVSMGNPHFVIFVKDISEVNLAREGAAIERQPLFPCGCNIEFVEVKADGVLRTRVWERGSGITMACGTGACATAVAAKLTGVNAGKSIIAMDGGNLQIEWNSEDNHIYMTGPAATVFEGEIEIL